MKRPGRRIGVKTRGTESRRRQKHPQAVAPGHTTLTSRPRESGKEENEKEDNVPPFLVGAVGASAGGLVAFWSLLGRLPKDAPLALVLVQHLSPDRRSMLPELLRRKTELKVEAGEDDVSIEPGHVYVIPPDTHMTVHDGRLKVGPRPDGGPGPIDALFLSVADQYRDRAVGVVLSGSGYDGAIGMRAINEAGGITLAQRPEEAEMDNMPRAAIETGGVDEVCPVGEIADRLLRLATHPFFLRPSAGNVDSEDSDPAAETTRRRIFQLLRRATGVDFNHYKTPTIRRRIDRRMVLHRLSSLEDYAQRLERDQEELSRLHDDLLIHVTSFFRDASSFEALAEVVANVPRELRTSPFRVWVPGCSTGEEAYSVAMSLIEALGDQADAVPLQLFGTDVSQSTIDRARFGAYPATIRADVSPQRLRRFFVPFDRGFRISKAIRDCCVFARQDVTRDPPFSKLDLVVCRNLLIYLTQAAQRKVMTAFHYALNPDGLLMLGRSETVGPHSDLFSVVEKRVQLYRRKQGRSRMEIEFDTPTTERRPIVVSSPAMKRVPTTTDWNAQNEANRYLLDRYAPPGVIVDEQLRIIRTRGRTGPYLELPNGDVTFELLKMVRSELVFGTRAVLQEARAHGKPTTRAGVKFKHEGVVRTLTLHAIPIGHDEPNHTLVLFEEAASKGAKRRPGQPAAGRKDPAAESRAVEELRQELEGTRQQLQSIIDDLGAANEELQSANEEILSSNEELQSTNEELDTTKEELQSTNEELSTLNDELHGRNEELSRANSDLTNLLNSVEIPIVIVGDDLTIRRFTPAAEKVMNIIPSDVGRPIGHLKPNFSCPDLEGLICEVIRSAAIHSREVHGHDGRVFALQIRPYKIVDKEVEGAVMSLFDLSEARDHEALLKAARDTAAAIIATVSAPILVLGEGMDVENVNSAFLERFQLTREEVEGHSIYAMGAENWDLPPLRRLLEDSLSTGEHVKGVAITADIPRVGRQSLMIDGRRIDPAPARSALTVLVFREGGGNAA